MLRCYYPLFKCVKYQSNYMHGDTVVHAIESTRGKKVFEDNETIQNIIDVAMEYDVDAIYEKLQTMETVS